MKALYQDSRITMTEEGINIGSYFFPLGGSKFIAWSQIKSVTSKRMGFWSGKYRLWGMGSNFVWFNEDSTRGKKDFKLVINTGNLIRVGLTPDYFELAEAAISTKIKIEKH